MRGVDFFVGRVTPYPRQVMITERGLTRAKLHAYGVYRDAGHALTAMPQENRPVNLRTDLCYSERSLRLKAATQQAFRAYFDHPLRAA